MSLVFIHAVSHTAGEPCYLWPADGKSTMSQSLQSPAIPSSTGTYPPPASPEGPDHFWAGNCTGQAAGSWHRHRCYIFGYAKILWHRFPITTMTMLLGAVFWITEHKKGPLRGIKGKLAEYWQFTEATKLSNLLEVTQEICRGTKWRIWFFLVLSSCPNSWPRFCDTWKYAFSPTAKYFKLQTSYCPLRVFYLWKL